MAGFNGWTEFQRAIRQIRKQGIRLAFMAGMDKLMRAFGNQPAGRFNRISPQIILGGQPAQRHLIKLAQAGVTGIINMRDEYSYEEQVGATNMNYLELPTVDNTPPKQEDLQRGVEFIQHEVERGGSVYIHCWEGLGRGPAMVAAYFIRTGCTPEEAWSKIRKARPFVRPTDEQMDALVIFAENGQASHDATIGEENASTLSV
jgi:protein-tyrosine phosphatase